MGNNLYSRSLYLNEISGCWLQVKNVNFQIISLFLIKICKLTFEVRERKNPLSLSLSIKHLKTFDRGERILVLNDKNSSKKKIPD